jgi:hypothetical protein
MCPESKDWLVKQDPDFYTFEEALTVIAKKLGLNDTDVLENTSVFSIAYDALKTALEGNYLRSWIIHHKTGQAFELSGHQWQIRHAVEYDPEERLFAVKKLRAGKYDFEPMIIKGWLCVLRSELDYVKNNGKPVGILIKRYSKSGFIPMERSKDKQKDKDIKRMKEWIIKFLKEHPDKKETAFPNKKAVFETYWAEMKPKSTITFNKFETEWNKKVPDISSWKSA